MIANIQRDEPVSVSILIQIIFLGMVRIVEQLQCNEAGSGILFVGIVIRSLLHLPVQPIAKAVLLETDLELGTHHVQDYRIHAAVRYQHQYRHVV